MVHSVLSQLKQIINFILALLRLLYMVEGRKLFIWWQSQTAYFRGHRVNCIFNVYYYQIELIRKIMDNSVLSQLKQHINIILGLLKLTLDM
jgi:hypothetical protein